MEIGTTIAVIVAVGEFVAICFMTPMVGRIGEIEKKLIEMDKKLKTDEQLDDAIDLKIYGHMNKCAAHQGAAFSKTKKINLDEL